MNAFEVEEQRASPKQRNQAAKTAADPAPPRPTSASPGRDDNEPEPEPLWKKQRIAALQARVLLEHQMELEVEHARDLLEGVMWKVEKALVRSLAQSACGSWACSESLLVFVAEEPRVGSPHEGRHRCDGPERLAAVRGIAAGGGGDALRPACHAGQPAAGSGSRRSAVRDSCQCVAGAPWW